VLKASGEILAGDRGVGFDPAVLDRVAGEVAEVHDLGVEVVLVIGGGNIFRGMGAEARGVERITGDNMGMIATVINALALQDRLEHLGRPTRVMSAIDMPQVCEAYIRRRAERHLEKRRIVISAAGTGNPYFTTDSAAALRAVELGADVLLKGTKVDGVYTDDPVRVPSATRYDSLSFRQVLEDGLQVMDSTAVALCMENRLPIRVFKITDPGALKSVILGQGSSTVVGDDGGTGPTPDRVVKPTRGGS
jgi:uridylate kinase